MKYLIFLFAMIGFVGLINDAEGSGLESSHLQNGWHVSSADDQNSTDISFLPDQVSASCPTFCAGPMAFGGKVRSVDVQDLQGFITAGKGNNAGVVIDTRSPGWYQRGTIPGAINIPYTVFEKTADNQQLVSALEKLGVQPRHHVNLVLRMFEHFGLFGGKMKTAHWDFTHARNIALVCNDAWCRQSPRAIKALLAMGYPAQKIYYYRAGLQGWESLGMTVQVPRLDHLASR